MNRIETWTWIPLTDGNDNHKSHYDVCELKLEVLTVEKNKQNRTKDRRGNEIRVLLRKEWVGRYMLACQPWYIHEMKISAEGNSDNATSGIACEMDLSK